MSILKAMNQNTLLAAAHGYADCGISIVPVSGKAATVYWSPFQEIRPTEQELTTWFTRRVTGLAIVSGAVSQNLVIVDLDGRHAANVFSQQFPHLRETLIVASANGWHCYYYVDELPNTTRLVNVNGIKEIGVRGNGHYTVAPPSRHPSGVRYKPITVNRPLAVGSLHDVVTWLNSQRPQPRPPKPVSSRPRSTGANPAYVNAVVDYELSYVRTAAKGTRNDNLYHASRRLGALCANPDSGLSETSLKAALAQAAAHLAADDGEQSVLRTIESGWRAGTRSPKPIPSYD